MQLDSAVKLGELQLLGTSHDFDVEVVVADTPGATRDAWGSAVATKKGVGTETTLDLDGRTGAVVLVWITNPTSTVASIGEVRITAA